MTDTFQPTAPAGAVGIGGSSPEVILGLPDCRPDFILAARTLGAPVMLSASAFARSWTTDMRDRDLPHPGFRAPPAGRLDGLAAALDSMGYTAMRRFGGFPFTPEQYVRLAAAHPWRFWSSMDLCCEPEIAGDGEEIVARILGSAHLWNRLADLADQHAIPRPLKALQGWAWWHYEMAAESLDITDQDRLIGIGSVCRRRRNGPDGVNAIVDHLDRMLPAAVRLHLFGVTSDALEELASHPRVASMDSQAWGAALRREHPTGRTNALAIAYMARFYRAQQAHVRRGRRGSPPSHALPLRAPPIWAARPDAYRRRAAEILHAIRNGHLEAWHYGLTIGLFDHDSLRAAA